jgi:quinohemoprotein ethanol dehydrogenase
MIAEGSATHVAACVQCHDVPGSTRAATSRTSATSRPKRQSEGLCVQGLVPRTRHAGFTGKLTEAEVMKIQAFIEGTADAIRPK